MPEDIPELEVDTNDNPAVETAEPDNVVPFEKKQSTPIEDMLVGGSDEDEKENEVREPTEYEQLIQNLVNDECTILHQCYNGAEAVFKQVLREKGVSEDQLEATLQQSAFGMHAGQAAVKMYEKVTDQITAEIPEDAS